MNFFGGKANPVTPFEKMNQKAQEMFQRPFDELTGQERQLLEAQHPTIARQSAEQTERRARGGHKPSQARHEFAQIDDERIFNEGQLVQAFTAGELSEQQFADAIEDLQFAAAQKKRSVTETLGIEFGVPTSDAAAALSAWYDTFDQAEIAPGVIDFEEREALEIALFGRIASGEFGDPANAGRAIEGRRRANHDPDTNAYFQAKDYIGTTNYYPIRDEVFESVRHRIPVFSEAGITRYSALDPAISFAVRSGDQQRAAELQQAKSAIDRIIGQRRQALRAQDQVLDTALRVTGRVSATSGF